MSSEQPIHVDAVPLPTLTLLNVSSLPDDLNVQAIARVWFDQFSASVVSQDASHVCDHLLLPTAVWRDLLSLTWDFRIIRASSGKLMRFLKDQLPIFQPQGFTMRSGDGLISLQRPYPDLAWISLMFDFHTTIGICSGVARLVPTQTGEWKAHAVLTNLEDLHGSPEMIGPLRNFQPNHRRWEQERQKELEFEGSNPQVLIIGAGQSGLIMAARLKTLGVKVLVVEKNARVGDNWRDRYDALCLHDPVCEWRPYIDLSS